MLQAVFKVLTFSSSIKLTDPGQAAQADWVVILIVETEAGGHFECVEVRLLQETGGEANYWDNSSSYRAYFSVAFLRCQSSHP